MEFVHRPFNSGDTVAAIATPPGEGGIAIIRISGKDAFSIADSLFSKPVKNFLSHTAHFGMIKDPEGNPIDQGLLLLMKGPRSYTGEDTVELQCHGGMIASRRVLEAVIAQGARLANPGEFTFRAFLNGKMDLAEAEAVQKLIQAKNEYAFEAASDHLKGRFSEVIKALQKDLVEVAAILEAWVDFPEEGIEFATLEEMAERLECISNKIQKILATFSDGQKIDKGISLCILGPPNAGKSSLLNALLGKDRAIVTPIAGTTRDLLHEDLQIGGLHFKLTDTAGLRETEEEIEREGIRRSKEAVKGADLILLVLDATQDGQEAFEFLPKEKTVAVWNKMDLPLAKPSQTPFPYEIKISAKERIGLDLLKENILKIIWEKGAPAKDEIIISSLRHKNALSHALNHIHKAANGLQENISPEFLTMDLRESLLELGTIIGSNISEDILSSIFSQFCIGK